MISYAYFTSRSVFKRTCIECVNEVEDRGSQPKSKLFEICINDTNGIQDLQALRPMKRVKKAIEIAAAPCPMIYNNFKDPERAVDACFRPLNTYISHRPRLLQGSQLLRVSTENPDLHSYAATTSYYGLSLSPASCLRPVITPI